MRPVTELQPVKRPIISGSLWSMAWSGRISQQQKVVSKRGCASSRGSTTPQSTPSLSTKHASDRSAWRETFRSSVD